MCIYAATTKRTDREVTSDRQEERHLFSFQSVDGACMRRSPLQNSEKHFGCMYTSVLHLFLLVLFLYRCFLQRKRREHRFSLVVGVHTVALSSSSLSICFNKKRRLRSSLREKQVVFFSSSFFLPSLLQLPSSRPITREKKTLKPSITFKGRERYHLYRSQREEQKRRRRRRRIHCFYPVYP